MKLGVFITLLGLLHPLSAQDGKSIYQTYCSACHGANGEGRTGAAPALAQSSWVNGDPAIITRILLHGLQGSLTIHGETYDLVMPAQSLLSDQQMADVATYVRGQWGNKAEPVTVEFIEKTRAANKHQNGVINSPHLKKPYDLKDYTLKIENLLSASYEFTTDFDSLKDKTPKTIEEEKDGLINPLQSGSQKESFTAKWTGLVKTKQKGEYHFSFGTDHAARISIDGKVILERNEGTPPSVGTITLPKGKSEIEIYYAHKAETPILCRLFLSGPELNMHRMHDAGKKKKAPPITINPTSERPLVHRNFLVKGGERMLAVGFKENVNFYFSTENMRLTQVWKGEFLNVGATWDGRARGKITSPLGKSVPVIQKGSVFKISPSELEKWKNADAEPIGQQFKGYSFDKENNLKFDYRIGEYLFSEHFSVSENGESLVRKIDIEPSADTKQRIHWKLLEKATKGSSNSFQSESGVFLNITSSDTDPRLTDGNLILSISQPSTITFEYVWK